jgi:hypothetical protein
MRETRDIEIQREGERKKERGERREEGESK